MEKKNLSSVNYGALCIHKLCTVGDKKILYDLDINIDRYELIS